MESTQYQLIILGGGPAGLTAGLYASRARLKALMLEKGAVGGQVLSTDQVDNYPGFTDGLGGFELIDKMSTHAERFGLETQIGNVLSIDIDGEIKTLNLEDGASLSCQALIICTGARPRGLDVPGETEFADKGVSYCATCDAPFYRNQEIAVVGGGNTAIQEALHLTKFADKVTVIHRRDELRATEILQEKAFANDKIEICWNSVVESIEGGSTGVEQLRLRNTDGEISALPVTGVFILVGVIPNNDALAIDQLKTNAAGFVETDQEMCTSLPGVMAAGDIRAKKFRQIVNAAGEGAVAELSAEEYLGGLR